MEQHLSRLAQIDAEDLVGHYTHNIGLHIDTRVTIMHGPNGWAKAVLLKLLDNLFADRYVDLHRVAFRLFCVSLADRRALEVTPRFSETDGAVMRITRFTLQTLDATRAQRPFLAIHVVANVAQEQGIIRLL